MDVSRFHIIACDNGTFIVMDTGRTRGAAVCLPDEAAVIRHCVNTITDERGTQ